MATVEFNEMVTRYSYSLKPFALSLTRDMEDAKDLIQETVFRALSSEDKYAAGTNLKAWLYTIMKNIFINNYRRRMTRNTLIDRTDELYFINSASASMPNGGESRVALSDINNEIDRLNDDYRTPFMLHYQGFKYHEIADHLTLPIGTVKSRIHFARQELKKKLGRN
jgi:RNA polymerase sigma-70 factor (ECF subfamily)